MNDLNKKNYICLSPFYDILIKFADVTDVQMLLILIMNKNVTLHPNSSYFQMCISKIQKQYTIIINIMRLFEIYLKYHSLEHAETILDSYFVKEMNGLVSTTFSLEQKSGFKFERNKDLTFIVIIIDID